MAMRVARRRLHTRRVSTAPPTGVPTLVQSANNSGNDVSSLTVTLPAAPVAGNVLVAWVATTSGSGPAAASFTLRAEATSVNPNLYLYDRRVQVGDGAAWTVTLPAGGAVMRIEEWSGLAATTPFDKAGTSGTAAGSTTAVAATAALAQANSVVLGACVTDFATDTLSAVSSPLGLPVVATLTGQNTATAAAARMVIDSAVVSSAAAANVTWTWGGTAGNREVITAAYRGAAGASSTRAVTGMYLNWNGAANITNYETTNAISVPYGHEFGDQAQWSFFTGGTNFSNWNTWVGAKAGRRFTYSCPLLTANDDPGLTIVQKYAALAAGTYDGNFTAVGNAFQAQPNLRNAIVRLGWEFNGNSRAWGVPPNDQTTLNNYKTGFNRAAAAMKAACPTLQIEWCPNCQMDYTNRLFADMWPGGTHIDYVGIGLYDYYWPGGTPTQAQREAWLRDSPNGLADQVALATAQGKKLAHTEWGLWATTSTGGGGDRPAFIDFMANWYATHNYAYHIYNNVTADGEHRLDVYPNSKARYLARFGTGALV